MDKKNNMHLFCLKKKKNCPEGICTIQGCVMPGDNGRCFISLAGWLRPEIYRSLGRVKMNHCKHG